MNTKKKKKETVPRLNGSHPIIPDVAALPKNKLICPKIVWA